MPALFPAVRVRFTEIAGRSESTGRTTAQARFKRSAITAFTLGFLVAHLGQDRRDLPEGVEIILEDIADHQRDKSAWGNVSIRP